MDSYSVSFRIKKRWVRTTLVVLVTALIVAPITAYAADRFTDVPGSNTFHDDISWLADADVTRGCNPPSNTRYCPSDFVTRGQMAAFLRRLAENQVVDAATAIDAGDADTVDGLDANSLVRANRVGTTISINDFAESEFTSILDADVTAPVNGVLLIWATVNAEWDVSSTPGSNADLDTQIFVGGTAVGEFVDQEFAEVANGQNSGESIAVTAAIPVTAGDHTVTIQSRTVGSSMIFIKARAITTLFVPFGDDGQLGVLDVITDSFTGESPND